MTSNASLHLGAIGIDFGSSRSVIAVAKKGGVDVIANEASLRETRNIVGYGPIQRYSGESANAQVISQIFYSILIILYLGQEQLQEHYSFLQ